ncbi:MAG: hypothetical protein IIB73_05615 [Proteobacteria bacterium]|nr:hypothetical protein [Pseudomonadota bacterium]
MIIIINRREMVKLEYSNAACLNTCPAQWRLACNISHIKPESSIQQAGASSP